MALSEADQQLGDGATSAVGPVETRGKRRKDEEPERRHTAGDERASTSRHTATFSAST